VSDKRVLVIGAGMGGLLLAQKLNQSRIPVTLFEKNAFAGGYNGQIRMGQTLVPLISYKALGLAPGTRLRALFEQCAPEAASRIQRMDFCDYLVFDDAEYQLPGNPVGFQKALQHAFPDQSAAITNFMETVHAIYKGLEGAFGSNTQSERNASLKALASLPFGTFEEFLTNSVTHPRLRAILS
jgi:1-hydroxycarotenoid 3,4-desaturase